MYVYYLYREILVEKEYISSTPQNAHLCAIVAVSFLVPFSNRMASGIPSDDWRNVAIPQTKRQLLPCATVQSDKGGRKKQAAMAEHAEPSGK